MSTKNQPLDGKLGKLGIIILAKRLTHRVLDPQVASMCELELL